MSICFQFTPTLTVRLYITHPQESVDTKNISIHNHLYDSQILVLSGWIRNRVYRLVEGNEYYHYNLISALHPENAEQKIKLNNLGKVGLQMDSERTLRPGNWHFQSHDEIHNVTNDPAAITGFMVFEFPTVKQHSIIFSKSEMGKTIPTPGCYNRFERRELLFLVNELLETM